MAFPVFAGRFQIDRMKADDLDQVIAMALATPKLHTGTDSPQFYSRETLLRWSEAERGLLLVKRLDNAVLAFAMTSANPDCRDGYIHCVVTHPDFRGRGHASDLLEFTFAWLRDKMECNNVFCLVHPDNTAMLKFCQKAGMTVGKQFSYVQCSLA